MLPFLKGIVELMRPAEWSKSLLNMAIAVAFAGFMYNISFSYELFLLGAASVCLLWSGLYTLNDYTDRFEDAAHPLKKIRAIPSGRVPASFALFLSISLIAISFSLGFLIAFSTKNFLFIICLLAMLINQILYTMKPFNFKKRPIVDLISGSLVNPTFRFYAGWTLFVPHLNAPPLALLFIMGLQFGGYGIYRLMSEEHDKNRKYRSSVALYGDRLKPIFYASLAISVFAFFFACANSIINIPGIGALPLRYLILVFLSALPAPYYLHVLKNPKNVDNVKSYRLIYRLLYVHSFLFMLGFLLLYTLF